jgi:hypothetical protein
MKKQLNIEDFKPLFKMVGLHCYKCMVCGAELIIKHYHARRHNFGDIRVIKINHKKTKYYYVKTDEKIS